MKNEKTIKTVTSNPKFKMPDGMKSVEVPINCLSQINFVTEYSIGLDLGTNSVGWAVIDRGYNLLRFKHKHMWGVRLWQENENDKSSSNEARRSFRSTRRRLERRKERLYLLQTLFSESVNSVDQSFFMRLDMSFLNNISKDPEFGRTNMYNLFDGEYTDRDYYKQFPTIYHLRKTLMETDKQFDPRLIYLAMHHIIKYRGNFLYDGEMESYTGEIDNSIKAFFAELTESKLVGEAESDTYVNAFNDNAEKIIEILKDKSIPKRLSKIAKQKFPDKLSKEDCIIQLFGGFEPLCKVAKAFTNAVLGYEFSVRTVLCQPDESKEDKLKISFRNAEDDKKDEIISKIGEDQDLFIMLEQIYTALNFDSIMNGSDFISDAMIKKHLKHCDDLGVLRKLNAQNKDVVFPKFNKKRDDFYKDLEKALTNIIEDSDDKSYIYNEIANETFMPKINDVANGAIPHQFNLRELKAIIDSQRKYYPELDKNADKIISILTFKRPYFVGVLSSKKSISPYSWAQDAVNERVYPWNFEEVVGKNYDKLSEAFIAQMTIKCAFFKDERVLPLSSIIYQSYIVLNELNKIKIDGKLINPIVKQSVFVKLFCNKKSVSKKDLQVFLLKEHGISVEVDAITGLSDEKKFTGAMSSLADFKRILGSSFNMSDIDKYESAIRYLTTFKDKKILKAKLKEIEGFSEDHINSFINLNYKKWGRYSNKFLNGIVDKRRRTVIQELYEGVNERSECYHVNELIYDENLGFKEQLVVEDAQIESFDYESHIKDLYCSPSVKRQLWQALSVVEELVRIMKCPPQNIFIETTRKDNVKIKKDSRAETLSKLYNSIRDDIKKGDLEAKKYYNGKAYVEIVKLKEEADKFKQDKIYLYLTQMGKCMYTGEEITLDALPDCEIDHIVPRSYIKDDSLSNRVLVKRIANQQKNNTLALNENIRKSQAGFWKFLCDRKLISVKKYYNLMKESYTASDLSGFINRQLVETNQTSKLAVDLLSMKYGRENVKPIKAGLVTEFRQQQSDSGKAGFTKLRMVNDMHHAKDAYLVAVLGRFTTYSLPCWNRDERLYFLRQRLERFKEETAGLNEYQKTKKYNELINERYSIILDLFANGTHNDFIDKETGELINSSFNTVLTTMGYNDCLTTVKIKIKANGAFYKQTINKKSSDKLIPLKFRYDNNGIKRPLPTELYGGYKNEKSEYMVIVKYKNKKSGKFKYALKNIPVLISYNEKSCQGEILNYLKKELNAEEIEIIRKVHKMQLIKIDGQLVRIVNDGEIINATQITFDSKFDLLLKFAERSGKQISAKEQDKYDKLANGDLAEQFIEHYIEKTKKLLPLYKKLPNIIQNFYDSESGFKQLTFERKLAYINILLQLTQAKSKSIKGEGEFKEAIVSGRMEKTIYPEKVEWISQSVTGLFEKKEKRIIR